MSSPIYRFEIAKTNRAGCQNSACKNDKIKIQKGELRFGSLVTIKEHTSWQWKHWGCVTPHNIGVIQQQLGGLEGYDLDNDLDVLDGWDELEAWAQNKIRESIRNGHVADEDWKGAPELNRPGQKGINRRTPKKKKASEDDDEEDAEDVEKTPTKPKKGSKRKAALSDEEDEPTPKKKTKTKKRISASEDKEDAENKPPKRKLAAKSKKRAVKDEDTDTDEPAPEPPKRSGRARKIKAESDEEDVGMAQLDGPADEDAIPLGKPKKSKRGKSYAEKKKEVEEYDAMSPLSKDAHPLQEVKAKRGQAEDRAAAEMAKAEDEQGKRSRSTRESTKPTTTANGAKEDDNAQESAAQTRSTKSTSSAAKAKGTSGKVKKGRSTKAK